MHCSLYKGWKRTPHIFLLIRHMQIYTYIFDSICKHSCFEMDTKDSISKETSPAMIRTDLKL